MLRPIKFTATIERKHPKLPRFIVVPSEAVASWKLHQTTTVEGAVNGLRLGRRSLKKWDDARWFIELTEPICNRAGIDTGDRVLLSLQIASDKLPEELAKLLANSSRAKKAWTSLTPSAQRMLREYIADAKQPATRQRRASRSLGIGPF